MNDNSHAIVSLGAALRTARELQKLSMRDVEKATGISNAYVSQIETGHVKHPSPSFLAKLATLYGLDFNSLMNLAGHLPEMLSLRKNLHKWSPKFIAQKITPEEESELLDYLLFIRARRARSSRELRSPEGWGKLGAP